MGRSCYVARAGQELVAVGSSDRWRLPCDPRPHFKMSSSACATLTAALTSRSRYEGRGSPEVGNGQVDGQNVDNVKLLQSTVVWWFWSSLLRSQSTSAHIPQGDILPSGNTETKAAPVALSPTGFASRLCQKGMSCAGAFLPMWAGSGAPASGPLLFSPLISLQSFSLNS